MDYKWDILNKSRKSRTGRDDINWIVDTLLKNRGIKTKKQKDEFFKPTPPEKITVKSLGLSQGEINKAIQRLKDAKRKKEKVIIYGDYDADGISATAILWECLYALGLDVLPYIPERFSEGYGINVESVKKLKAESSELKVILTVDNGIVAYEAIDTANELGIDVIIVDHHQKSKKKLKAHSIIHTSEICGSGIAWKFAREIAKELKELRTQEIKSSLDLVAIGTISDQIPLIGPNRSFVKYGLEVLNTSIRPGLAELYKEAGLEKGSIGVYEVGFIIAPRINAMGRLEHALESLRLLCTRSRPRAKELALKLGKTNKKRQKIVDEVLLHSKALIEKSELKSLIIVAHESYHEGVIGLAASKLVEVFYRPVIVISKGEKISKASARSISGFNIIEAIQQVDDLLLEGGGHPMAAGFSIESEKIEEFRQRLEEISQQLLNDKILSKKLKIDLEVNFDQLSPPNSNAGWEIIEILKKFEPTGVGNPTPTFATKKVNILDLRTVGYESQHLKLKVEKDNQVFDAIAFGFSHLYQNLLQNHKIDIVYHFEENIWNHEKSMQLKVKDIKLIK